jgi:hypothetical protein
MESPHTEQTKAVGRGQPRPIKNAEGVTHDKARILGCIWNRRFIVLQ